MHTYEIEIKSLLGSRENAGNFRKKLKEKDPNLELVGTNNQLNHYFNVPEDLSKLEENILPLVPSERADSLKKILEEGKSFSIRTRKTGEDTVIFVIKASVGDDTSSNGVARIEFEGQVPKTLEELDQTLLDSGLSYQAKWSREREEYKSGNLNITIDRNAGYGYLAEFERVVESASRVDEVKAELLGFMSEIGVEELKQDRLERMFDFYNKNWRDYYGTENVFVIE